MLKCSKLKS
ncbi:hypothetical protein F383_31587 [Gossypium arboreum]|uniref:Uncharacterized protein n=1 Tax=Gossypium arboreum TaxID=29729 RepID=A0A0B0PJ23_GOSAR|nr:hypothetical protein F383_31587 [Gossypium arboreum]